MKRKNDRQALLEIFGAVDEETLLQLDSKKTTKDARESAKTMNFGVPG